MTATWVQRRLVHLPDASRLHGIVCNRPHSMHTPKTTKDPAKVTCKMCLRHIDGDDDGD
jgi:hypothetical protein